MKKNKKLKQKYPKKHKKSKQNNDFQYQQVKPQSINQSVDISETQKTQNYIFDQQYSQKPKIVNKKIRNKQKHSLSYRPDIDGLRAIAVISVVIFHAWPEFLTGGFIGVDIFFVISGYLITKIILKEQEFSFWNFYNRRIKRIFPATLVVLLFTLIFVMFSQDVTNQNFQQICRTIRSSTFFGTNLDLLYKQRGYFDQDIKNNAGLHLWSLSVQEQFYVIWPVFLIIVNKFCSKDMVLPTLIIFTLISFSTNLYYSKKDSLFDYYFPICRFWEMSMGGIVSLVTLKDRCFRNIFSWAGILLILIYSFRLNQGNIYPGYLALIPTISCCLIILGNQNSYLNHYILSSKILTFIGKISYPMYLWHWPIIVFAKLTYKRLQNYEILMLLILVVILSTITYYFVQNKIRYSKSIYSTIVLITTMVCIFGMSSFLLYHRANNEKPIQLPQLLQHQQTKNIQKTPVPQQKKVFQIPQLSLSVEQSYSASLADLLLQSQSQKVKKKQQDTELSKQKQSQYQKISRLQQKTLKPQQKTQKLQQNTPKPQEKILKLQEKASKSQEKASKSQQKTEKLQQKTLQSQSQQQILKLLFPELPKFQLSMLPKSNDHILTKNGVKLPNNSVNRKRTKPTAQHVDFIINYLKTQYAREDNVKQVTPQSVYYERLDPFAGIASVNQGINKKYNLFVVGDSHAGMVGWRLSYLYDKSIKQNKLQSFPNSIIFSDGGNPPFSCAPFFYNIIKYIKKHKPNRVFFVYRWLFYWKKLVNNNSQNFRQAPCMYGGDKQSTQRFVRLQHQKFSKADIQRQLKDFSNQIKKLVQMGIQVYVATINPEGRQFNPRQMYKKNGVVVDSQPISLSKFKDKYKIIIDPLQKSIKQAGGKIIDFSDHQCYNDICQKFMPNGYPIFFDTDHYHKFFARYWASAMDVITQFQ